MFKRILFGSLMFFPLIPSSAFPQSLCPLNGIASDKLICVIPQVYGARPLGNANEFPAANSFAPINAAVGTQVSTLPMASPSSGISFVYDPSLKSFTVANESLGPVLGERARTIGRNRLFLGFSYQFLKFDSIDGKKLKALPDAVKHLPVKDFPSPENTPADDLEAVQPACNPQGLPTDYVHTQFGVQVPDPCLVRDLITSTYDVDFRISQYIMYITYGATSRLDVSVAVPFLNVRMNVITNSTIVPNSVAFSILDLPGNINHVFFNPNCPKPCLSQTFRNAGRAIGIGDVVFRGKYQLYKGEKAGFAVGLDVRTPSGNEENYTGAGALGFKQFAVFSYSGRVSPHASIGYESNGKSILAGNVVGASSNTKGKLPDRFIYVVGADASIFKRLTAAFDLYGQRLYGAPEVLSSQFVDFGKCSDEACTAVAPGVAHPILTSKGTDLNILDASIGAKIRLIRNLVATGNVLLKLNDSGLRAKVVPLAGISYSF